MPTLLLTGFEPFHTHPDNPSANAASELDGANLGHVQVVSALLPVEPRTAAQKLLGLLSRLSPDAVLLTGLAAGRPHVSLERVAVNVMDFNIPDNAGNTYRDAPAHEHEAAPAAYLSTLPLRNILQAWREAEIPGQISNTAGLYLCNFVMYQALHYLTETNAAHVPCGFLHVPANPAVALAVPEDRPALPYLPQGEITRAVKMAAETTVRGMKNRATDQ
ncbi:pyroglutamyl-peptidase I [Deinococcus cavernae]|uniref:Pyroglutamyl-peptidase I n=1 Tax=Deinococcus cavernae TaxID=2320857 RepID=A0A418VBW7_9DEIO|nr:pyroglutamyl-peptidase I [Deinococcus cavernae]RJF73607.1 pyroglutamyl-peptidase I [Deinococcus cavernae]